MNIIKIIQLIKEESKTFYLNNNIYSNKIKANEVKVDILNQQSKTTNSKFNKIKEANKEGKK